MKNLLLLFALIFSFNLNAQIIPGKWLTFDEETKEKTSLIELSVKEDGKLYGKIIELYKNKGSKCINCTGRHKDQPKLGLELVWGFVKKNDRTWKDGEIIDPRNGKIYSCKLTLKDDNTLKVRGYIGTPMLGKTKIWKRAE